MPKPAAKVFRVHARDIDRHHARLVEEVSFEAAAVAYVEGHPAAPEDGHELKVVVHEVESGREHCFRIDLDTGQSAPC